MKTGLIALILGLSLTSSFAEAKESRECSNKSVKSLFANTKPRSSGSPGQSVRPMAQGQTGSVR